METNKTWDFKFTPDHKTVWIKAEIRSRQEYFEFLEQLLEFELEKNWDDGP